MTNHVHLLLVPPAVNSLAILLKHAAGPQTRYVNGLERRTGTLCQAGINRVPLRPRPIC